MYDALHDAIMLESLMNRHAYYYPRPAEAVDTVVVGQDDNTGMIILIVVLGIGVVVIIGVAVARS